MKKELLSEELIKLSDYIRALRWWSSNLGIELTNGEYMIFNKVIDDMEKVVVGLKNTNNNEQKEETKNEYNEKE